MSRHYILIGLGVILSGGIALAEEQTTDSIPSLEVLGERAPIVHIAPATAPAVSPSRLTLGGYGEAVASRMLYSKNFKRYSDATLYKGDKGYGQVDLPHVVFFVGYDFGHGWSLGSEIEFEHGGTESAVEIEEEETGEYESEIERGGEVALEQFWLQKSFSRELNLRMGHLIVPVGATNAHHMPTEFFTVYRPEGEATILPCTWHETGISIWGEVKDWRYEAMVIAGLDADRFNNKNWIHGASGSPYEFKMASDVAGAFRIDNRSIKDLKLSLSGYVGGSGRNTLNATKKYDDILGLVAIGALDFRYEGRHFIARGNVDYGHLGQSLEISKTNKASRKDSPSPKNNVAMSAFAAATEVGCDLFSFIPSMRDRDQRLFLFTRYDYYDSMFRTVSHMSDEPEWERHKVTVGLNYSPIKEIVIKAEASERILRPQFNNEPTLSIGIAYMGMYKLL